MIKKIILVSFLFFIYKISIPQSKDCITELLQKSINDYRVYYKADTIRILSNKKFKNLIVNKPKILIVDSLNVNVVENNTNFIEFISCFKRKSYYYVCISSYIAARESDHVIFNFTGGVVFTYLYDRPKRTYKLCKRKEK